MAPETSGVPLAHKSFKYVLTFFMILISSASYSDGTHLSELKEYGRNYLKSYLIYIENSDENNPSQEINNLSARNETMKTQISQLQYRLDLLIKNAPNGPTESDLMAIYNERIRIRNNLENYYRIIDESDTLGRYNLRPNLSERPYAGQYLNEQYPLGERDWDRSEVFGRYSSRLEGRLSDLEYNIGRDRELKKRSLDQIENEIQNIRRGIEFSRAQNELVTSKEAADRLSRQYEATRQILENLRKELASIDAVISQLQNQNEQLRVQIPQKEARKTAIANELNNLRAQLENYKKSGNLQNIITELANAHAEYDKCKSEMLRLRVEGGNSVSGGMNEAQTREFLKYQERAQILEPKILELQARIGPYQQQLNNYQNAISAKESEFNKINNEIAQANQIVARNLNTIDFKKRQKTELPPQISARSSEFQNLKSQFDSATLAYMSAQRRLNDLEQQRIQPKEQEKRTIIDSMNLLDHQLADVRWVRQELTQILDSIRYSRLEIQRILSNPKGLIETPEMTALRSQIAELQNDIRINEQRITELTNGSQNLLKNVQDWEDYILSVVSGVVNN